MESREEKLLNLLDQTPQFKIPVFQRNYQWTEKECEQLWKDILLAGDGGGKEKKHFIGFIVYILERETLRAPEIVIDGQQRLTTVTLLLAALAEVLGSEQPVDGFSAEKIRSRYLLNYEEKDEEDDEDHYKLIPFSETDKEILKTIINGDSLEKDPSSHSHVKDNFEYFKKQVEEIKEKGKISNLCNGLAKLTAISIKLKKGEDDPQLIFESMNSKGLQLSQPDLIHNFVLIGLDTEIQKELHKNYWQPIENTFKVSVCPTNRYSSELNWLIYHYLTVMIVKKSGKRPNHDINNPEEKVYETFKDYFPKEDAADKTNTEALLKDLLNYAKYYCHMAWNHLASDKKPDPELTQAFKNVRPFTDIAYPLLLELYDDYEKKILSRDDFLEILHIFETYLVRRAICSIRNKSIEMWDTFSTFTRSVNKDNYLENIKAKFLIENFPEDDIFYKCIKNPYNLDHKLDQIKYCLKRFESENKTVNIDEYNSLEHIMPRKIHDQTNKRQKEWQKDLGQEWEHIYKTYLHTLGNLTLTKIDDNTRLSNRPFKKKRDMEFKDSKLQIINEGLGQLEKWGEQEIKERGERLANLALIKWPRPELPQEILDKYRDKQAPEEDIDSSIEEEHQLADERVE